MKALRAITQQPAILDIRLVLKKNTELFQDIWEEKHNINMSQAYCTSING